MDREIAGELKRYFNVVAEDLGSEIRAVAEGVGATNERLDRLQSRIGEEFDETRARIASPSASWNAASRLWCRT